MKRIIGMAVLAAVVGFSAAASFAAPPEPVGISLLRIEMKKNLVQQEAAPKQTELRKKKFEALQAAGKSDEAADAEVDYFQAQAVEMMVNLNGKELDLQLKDALNSVKAPPMVPPAPAPPAGAGAPGPGAANAPGAGQQVDPEMVASPTEIALLQLDLQKAQVQADVAKKIAENRQNLLAARQARADAKNPGAIVDSEADALGSQTAARIAALEVEAAQLRLDAAVKSAAPQK